MSFKIQICLLAVFFTVALCVEDFDSIQDLTVENFDSVIKSNPYCLVLFYAPWCPHCNDFKPEYVKAASVLEDKVVICKVDATKQKALNKPNGVSGVPKVLCFKNGTSTTYDGARKAEPLMNWVQGKL